MQGIRERFNPFKEKTLICGCTKSNSCPQARRILEAADTLPTPEARKGAYRAYITHRQGVNPVFAAALKVISGKRGTM